jgi:hypothetical protein
VIRYPYAEPVDRPPGDDETLYAVLRGVDAEDEPLVVTDRPDELARRFGGRIAAGPNGATRLVVPDVVVREGRRRPLLARLRQARALGIPVQSSSGAELTPASIVRRRLR